MILQTLYQQCIKHGVRFFDEYHVVDVIVDGGQTRGVVAYRIADGELHVFRVERGACSPRVASGACSGPPRTRTP